MTREVAMNLQLPAKAKALPKGLEVILLERKITIMGIVFVVKRADGKMFAGDRYHPNGDPVETREYSSTRLNII